METTSDVDELQAVAAEQRIELMNAKAVESDHEFAFRLQLEEAMAASLSLLPSTSSSSSLPISHPSGTGGNPSPELENDNTINLTDLQTKELDKFELEIRDRELCETEARRVKEDLFRRVHDQKFARDVRLKGNQEWEEYGDEFERPFGEGSSSSSVPNEIFRLYFKGLVSEERVKGSKVILSAIGVAICDARDNPIFELTKPLRGNGTSRQVTEIKALIEGLQTALVFDIKRIAFFCDYYPIYQFVAHRWHPKQRKISMLIDKVVLLTKKFTYCQPTLVARNDLKFAFKLARDAIISQISGSAEPSCSKIMTETCAICLEEVDVNHIFVVDGCSHRYCFSCMRQHVEVKLLHGMVPKCPHEGCKSDLSVNNCRAFLTPKLTEIMNQRINEASIPVTDKVYCPYPRCSALMSKSECSDFARKESVKGRMFGARKCAKCHRLFCLNCKTPWHSNMTCSEYKKLNPAPHAEDAKLKSLATKNLWRQCVKCNHMIELAEGCYHMTCRCGYEFCYTCGAQWKDKKATCSCPLFDDDYDEDDFEDEDDDESYYDSDSDDYGWL